MDDSDVLIVGGGPAGSSCAWKLRGSGLEVSIIDKERFPRNKVCGGWITPPVVDALSLDLEEYREGRVLQEITGFRTCRMGDRPVETRYGSPVSFGIRRCEFDEYLLRRSGARVHEGTPIQSLERRDGRWVVNGRFRANLIVGAGGHFCPVARHLGTRVRGEPVVAAQEIELPLSDEQKQDCAVRPEIPELYYCADLKGYAWCFRKDGFLNVGLGRLDTHGLASHVCEFMRFARERRLIPPQFPTALQGHAYLLYGAATRDPIADQALLIGDAAGLAYLYSGEGIRPAVESGLLAAQAIVAAKGDYSAAQLERYRRSIVSRFGEMKDSGLSKLVQRLPQGVTRYVTGKLFATRWFSRRVLLDRWFLHTHVPAL
jgi:flavin-dependent dehydrogenase